MNKSVHAKFIVVDNIIIVGTGDYTPSEFIYGDVSIDNSERSNMCGISYRGKYSKVNHYIIIEDRELAKQLIEFFNEILAQSDTYVHGAAAAAVEANRYYIQCPYNEKEEAKKIRRKMGQ